MQALELNPPPEQRLSLNECSLAHVTKDTRFTPGHILETPRNVKKGALRKAYHGVGNLSDLDLRQTCL